MDPSTLAQLLSGVFTGAAGLSQLGQAGTNAAAGASAADPFAQYRGQYSNTISGVLNMLSDQQNRLSNYGGAAITNLGNAPTGVNLNAGALGNAINWMAGLSNQVSNIPTQTAGGVTTAEAGSAGSLGAQLSSLAGNYMSNPAIQAQYKLGLSSAQRGIQASGYGASGQQLKELSDYGQQFASQAYQQQFQDILTANQQQFGQNMAVSQLQAALAGQNFQQALGGASLAGNLLAQEGGLASTYTGLDLQAQQSSIGNRLNQLTSVGNLVNQNYGELLGSTQNELGLLSQLSGATTGSPSTAGAILSGQFANTQTALGNLGSGITALGTGLQSAFGQSGGLSDILSNLFSSGGGSGALSALGGGISTYLSGLGGGIGDLATQLGSSTAGGFESLLAGGADSGISEGLSALMGL